MNSLTAAALIVAFGAAFWKQYYDPINSIEPLKLEEWNCCPGVNQD